MDASPSSRSARRGSWSTRSLPQKASERDLGHLNGQTERSATYSEEPLKVSERSELSTIVDNLVHTASDSLMDGPWILISADSWGGGLFGFNFFLLRLRGCTWVKTIIFVRNNRHEHRL
jgi:hypothetical protein